MFYQRERNCIGLFIWYWIQFHPSSAGVNDDYYEFVPMFVFCSHMECIDVDAIMRLKRRCDKRMCIVAGAADFGLLACRTLQNELLDVFSHFGQVTPCSCSSLHVASTPRCPIQALCTRIILRYAASGSGDIFAAFCIFSEESSSSPDSIV